MKVLIIGGAGAMAWVAARDLLECRDLERLGLADLRLENTKAVASRLSDSRVEPVEADARNPDGLAATMKDWDVVLNSTWYELNLSVMGAALRAGIHYLDLGGLYHMTLKQLELDPQAKDAGITCVLGLGSSPGVTNLMAAHGANRMETIREVKIRVAGVSLDRPSGFLNPPYSFRTILDETSLPAAVLHKGKIQMVPALSSMEEFELPPPVGKVEGYYTLHSELATLPSTLGKEVQEMNFIVAFSPEFSRAVSLLVKLGLARKEEVALPGGKVVPYELLTRLVDALPGPDTQTPNFGIRRVELIGEVEGGDAHLTYDCVSGPHARWGIGGRPLGTGVPASLGAQWLARGSVKARGVLPPELCIDPGRFLHELAENGRGIETFVDDGSGRKPL